MASESFTAKHRILGRVAAWAIFCVLVIYAVTLALGFLSLKSPQDPIGDPYVSILEILIVLLAPFYVVCMVAVHAYASPEDKAYSFTALAFMLLLAGITSCNHFVILTVSRQIESSGLTGASLLFSFTWPSVAYTVDILAWDWFFALAMLFAAPVFRGGGLTRAVRYCMIVSGVLSLIGLLGVPLAIRHVGYWFVVRNIGIVGYTVVAAAAFFLIALVFGRTKRVTG